MGNCSLFVSCGSRAQYAISLASSHVSEVPLSDEHQAIRVYAILNAKEAVWPFDTDREQE
jgi:hypothetical protein